MKRTFSQRFGVLGYTDTTCDLYWDSTSTWNQFVDSLRRKLIRKELKSMNTNKSNTNLNNTMLNTGNYFHSNPNQISMLNNIALENQTYIMEDHVWFQYYVNTINKQGWKVEPELWKKLLDKVKSMVMEIIKEGMQKAELSSPFTGKPTSTTTGTQYTRVCQKHTRKITPSSTITTTSCTIHLLSTKI